MTALVNLLTEVAVIILDCLFLPVTFEKLVKQQQHHLHTCALNYVPMCRTKCMCALRRVCICSCMRADDSVTGVSSPCQFRESKAVF